MGKAFDHVAYEAPKAKQIEVLRTVDGPVYEITDRERELVCTAIDRRGLWGTDIPLMLGLVDR